jgi:hypothetical protein
MVLKDISLTTNCAVKDVQLIKILGNVVSNNFIIEKFTLTDTELGDTTTTERSLLVLQGSYKNLKISDINFTTNVTAKYFTFVNMLSSDVTSVTLDSWYLSKMSMDNGFTIFKLDTGGKTGELDIKNVVVKDDSVVKEAKPFQILGEVTNTITVDKVTI